MTEELFNPLNLPENPASPIKSTVGRSKNGASWARMRLNLRNVSRDKPDNLIIYNVLKAFYPKHIDIVSGIPYISPEASKVGIAEYRKAYAFIP